MIILILMYSLAEMITRLAAAVEQLMHEILHFIHFCQKYMSVQRIRICVFLCIFDKSGFFAGSHARIVRQRGRILLSFPRGIISV